MGTTVDQTNGKVSNFWGYYAQVGWFLTGEHRPYDRVAGAIDRVKPHENFFRVPTAEGNRTGSGAWEVAFRVSHLELLDYAPLGGTMTDYTVGVNWYWNAYSKKVFNWIHSMPDERVGGQSTTNIFGLRMPVDF